VEIVFRECFESAKIEGARERKRERERERKKEREGGKRKKLA